MKKFILKALVAFAFLASSSFASAVCYQNLNDVPPGGPGLFSIHGMFCTQNIPPQQQGVAGPRIMQQQVVGMQNIGGGLSNCSVVGGIVGGTLGSLAKHHTAQAVILGGVAGGVLGNMICTNRQGQRVVVPQGQQHENVGYGNQGVYGGMQQQQGRTTHNPSDCDIDGRPDLQNMKGLTDAQCASIAGLSGTRHGGSSSMQQASVQQAKQAYCPITGPRGVVKNVLNAERRAAYCGELITALRSGSLSWDTLPVVQE